MDNGVASAMNNTKWDKIRLAMAALDPSPSYRTRCIDNGYISNWDHEWLYHFQIGGYECIEWLEISCETEQEKSNVLNALKKIHIPGETTPTGFMIYGYIKAGQVIEHI
jgi:hypothetical protein